MLFGRKYTSYEVIIGFVNELSKDKTVIFPMHPRARKIYGDAKRRFTENVNIIEPMDYFDLLMLLKNSDLVMTDSPRGGGYKKRRSGLRSHVLQ